MEPEQVNKQRVGIFVNVLNVFYAAKHRFEAKVDYRQLMRTLLNGRELVRAVAYVTCTDAKIDQSSFHGALRAIGYEVKVKDLKVYKGPDGRNSPSKSNWGVGMAVDILTIAPKLDTVILVTGDGDFLPLVEALQKSGCRVEIAGFEAGTAHELIRTANAYIPINESCMFKVDRKEEIDVPLGPDPIPKYTDLDAPLVEDLDEVDEVEVVGDRNGFGILGSTDRGKIDKSGLPKDSFLSSTGGEVL